MVVGGEDTALEEAVFFLTKLAKSVIIHSRNELRTSKILQQRASHNPKISIWNTIVEDIFGQNKVEGIKLKNTKTAELTEIKCDGVFIAIDKPNTNIFKGQVEIDDKGYIKRYEETKTIVEGIFVAGDVYDYTYRQAITAAGSGCKASLDAIKYLELNFE